MAFVRQGCALALSLTLWAVAALAEDQAPAAPTGLYDRPVLVVDPGMHNAVIWRAAADQEGRWAVTGSEDKTVRVWSLADGTLLRTIRLPAGPGNVGKAFAVAISPDGALIAVGGWTRWTEADPQQQIYLFDRDTGALVHRIEGLQAVVEHLVFSSDGERLAAALGGHDGLRIYSRRTGWAETARDEDYGDQSYGVALAPDGRLATTSWDGKVRLYAGDLHGSIEPTRVIEATGGERPFGIAFSPDGMRLAVGYDDTTQVDLLDAHTLAPLPRPDLAGIRNGDLSKVAWSHDGATLFAAGRYLPADGRRVLAWVDGGGGARRALPASSVTVMSLLPLPGGDLLVASADPWLARLAPDGTARWRHGPPGADFRDQFNRLSVSNDGSRVGFGFQVFGKSPARFDLATRSLVLAPAADASMAVPRLTGLPIEHWHNEYDPMLGGKKLPLEQYEMSRSLAVHPNGDRFVLGAEWSLRAFDAQGTQLWSRAVPGEVWAVNISGDGRLVVAAYQDGTIRWHRMTDGVELLALMPLANQTDWVAWTPEGFYAATPGVHGILRWHVNRGWDAPADSVPIEDIPGSYRPAMLPLVLQELETARAFGLLGLANHAQEVKLRTNSRVPPGAQLHLLAIGINAYGGKLQLNYARPDARDLASTIASTQEVLYRVSLQTLFDADASKKGIVDAIEAMRDLMAKGGNDLAVVYFSGHGAMVDDKLYLLPADVDASRPARIKSTGLSMDDLRDELVELAKHGRVLVLLDACHSGATSGDGVRLAMDSTRLRSGLAAANVTVLTSSSGDEFSYEDPAWQHGAFTRALLDAFGDAAADINQNGLISTTGLVRYVTNRVLALSDGRQHPGMEARFEATLFAVQP
jgi:WD40 repeat protein